MNRTESRSRKALRRLVILIVAIILLIVYSYGWTVTDIDFSIPQQPQRQQNVGNALRELLSPNVFTQEYEVQNTTASFGISCADDFTPTEPTITEGQPYIIVTPPCGASPEIVTVQGFNFYPDSLARINWLATDGERRIRQIVGTTEDNFVTRSDGSFEVQIEIPQIRGSRGETHTIEAQGRFPIGAIRVSDTTVLVGEKMLETIFLAFIATSVSVLPSVILSFFAAHNLMRPIRLPLGNLLIMVIFLPIGWLIGTVLLQPIGQFMYDLTSGVLTTTTGILILGLGSVASTRQLSSQMSPTTGMRLRTVLNTILVAVIVVAAFGLIGGLSRLISGALQEGILLYVGNFLGSVSQLIGLLLTPIAGVVGAFALSSIGTDATRDALKHISGSMSHIAGAVLGMLAGAVVLGGVATVGLAAAWLGLLPPIIAAGLAGAALSQIYKRVTAKPDEVIRRDGAVIDLVTWIGRIIGFLVTFEALRVRSALIENVIPSSAPAFQILGIGFPSYVLYAMLIGAVLGGITAGFSGTRTAFPIGDTMYSVTRTVLNLLRSIEPLIMGLVFVIWVGIGPFAGVLALALHSIASLGKLYSEQIENIDTGPIEALQSTGANRLQMIMYAVVPQIVPPYIAFTMYRWDINVRMSTIIGFVGGGGIGFLLQQQINLLRYRDAGVAVLAIAIVVSILDFASAAIRERAI